MPASLRNNKRAKVQRLVIAQPFSPLSEHRHLSALSTSLQSVFFSTVILTGGKKNLSADCHRVFPLPFYSIWYFFSEIVSIYKGNTFLMKTPALETDRSYRKVSLFILDFFFLLLLFESFSQMNVPRFLFLDCLRVGL